MLSGCWVHVCGNVWVHVYAFWVHVYGSVGCMYAVVGRMYAETFGCMYMPFGSISDMADSLPDSK